MREMDSLYSLLISGARFCVDVIYTAVEGDRVVGGHGGYMWEMEQMDVYAVVLLLILSPLRELVLLRLTTPPLVKPQQQPHRPFVTHTGEVNLTFAK